ncbi:MAG: hypothetical protein EAZ24_17240 [Burkholderiales bacterium]|nr:MAG: hypothetical protein EAZ24_17240 [Burkholderiales bacterium]
MAAIGKGNAKASTDNEARAAAADAPNAVARDAVAKRRDTQAGKEDAIHLPIGSILSGVTVTGIDAPTSAAAQRTPIPALLRLKANAILPNNYRVDIRECFVLVSGHGSLSTQRAKLRSNAISCVRNDGRVVESSLAGYVVGPDSREGVPGTLVHKSGEMIRNSLVAGVLSAGAARLGGTTTASLAGAGGLAAPGLLTGGGSDAAEGALAAGAGQSIAQISKLYLDMAKEAVPVIEVLPGTSVSLVLTSGVSLRFGK